MNIIKNCAWYLGQYLRGTRAIAAMEYAIIVGVVVVGVGAAVVAFQGQITEFIQQAGSDITATRSTMWQRRQRPQHPQHRQRRVMPGCYFRACGKPEG